jgi:class 3 adenylate cyclase
MDLYEQKIHRERYLLTLHHLAEGTTRAVSKQDVESYMGMELPELDKIASYLSGEGYTKEVTFTTVGLTHPGLKEVERLLSLPYEEIEGRVLWMINYLAGGSLSRLVLISALARRLVRDEGELYPIVNDLDERKGLITTLNEAVVLLPAGKEALEESHRPQKSVPPVMQRAGDVYNTTSEMSDTDLGNLVSQKPQSLRTWLGVDRGPIALAFTDIVGSTKMAVSMGDRSWIALLMEHFKKARHYTKINGGFEVKLIGDACMVLFRTADAALEFAMGFAADTGDSRISIRAGIHVGDVRVVENDIYGVMVNYTFRVQHSMRGSGIAISTPAKLRIEHELGADQRERFEIIPLMNHEPLKGFPEDQQTLWQITAPVKLRALKPSTKFDEYGNISFDDERARLDNFAIQLQNDSAAHGVIRVFAPLAGQASTRAERAKDHLVNTRAVDINRIVVIDGGFRENLTIQLFMRKNDKERII